MSKPWHRVSKAEISDRIGEYSRLAPAHPRAALTLLAALRGMAADECKFAIVSAEYAIARTMVGK